MTEIPRIQNSDIENRLLALPGQIATEERAAAECRTSLEQLKQDAADAELNCIIGAEIDGKNEEARKTQRKQALAKCADYQTAVKAAVRKEEQATQHDIAAKELSRSFAALCAIAELRASSYYAQTNKATKIQGS